MKSSRIFQINASPGGVPKTGLYSAEIDANGITVDRQADRKHHGGPLQNLCLLRLETIEELQQEGHPIFPGSTGENITIVGLPEEDFLPGHFLQLGSDVLIELTDYATPCKTIKASFLDGNFNRINEKKYPGSSRIYAKVLRGGSLQIGDRVLKVEMSESDL